MALKRKGKYWYGDDDADVWDYFAWYTRDCSPPVKHCQQAVCECGGTVFVVEGDEEEQRYQRTCMACEAEAVFFAKDYSRRPRWRTDLPLIECVCGTSEFEVFGLTAPFSCQSSKSAHTFYLGMRCVRCGCLGEYDCWFPRYNDAEAYLDML
jgi:hypothetical protein